MAPLPASPLVGLPIGDLEAAGFASGPVLPGRGDRIGVVTVEHEDQALVAVAIGRERRVVDQEADIGPVRIALLDRQDDRLVLDRKSVV